MRRLLFGFCLLALWGCAEQLPDRIYPVFFTPFSTQLDPPALAIVANAAATSKRFPKATVHVTGYADRKLLLPADPLSPVNRRIVLTLQRAWPRPASSQPAALGSPSVSSSPTVPSGSR